MELLAHCTMMLRVCLDAEAKVQWGGSAVFAQRMIALGDELEKRFGPVRGAVMTGGASSLASDRHRAAVAELPALLDLVIATATAATPPAEKSRNLGADLLETAVLAATKEPTWSSIKRAHGAVLAEGMLGAITNAPRLNSGVYGIVDVLSTAPRKLVISRARALS